MMRPCANFQAPPKFTHPKKNSFAHTHLDRDTHSHTHTHAPIETRMRLLKLATQLLCIFQLLVLLERFDHHRKHLLGLA